MPARITVHLESTGALPPVRPPHTRPAVNAAFLAALRDFGQTDMSSTLQETRPPEFVAPSPLLDERDRLAGVSSDTVRFEVRVLVDPLAVLTLQALAVTGNSWVARCVHRTAAAGLDALVRCSADSGIGDRTSIGRGHVLPPAR
ncbi:MAG TPA: hypothetical protein VFV01_01830 [Spirillospora sp.]|nr:hypothetical protein [Spirillospora sp.]